MKVAHSLTTIVLLFIFSAFNGVPESTAPEEIQLNLGTIEGTVELASRSRGIRSGGGLYGRPSRPTQQAASGDSVLIILSSLESNSDSELPIEFLNQKNRQFSPKVLPVKLGQSVRIQNSDPVYHNVFSLTSPHKFDVGRRPKGEHFDVTFEKPGMVDVFCDIHSNMHAIIYVMPENAVIWTKVAAGDHYAIVAPEGDYTLTYVALGYKETQVNVRVDDGEISSMGTITLNP